MTATDETMDFGGRQRRYILVKPKTYDAKKTYPLVLSFHGNPASAQAQRAILPFETVSKEEAIVAYPNAVESDWDFAANDNTDVPWMRPLVDEIAKKVTIDPKRVLGYGYSGGAYFISQAACRVGGVFKMITIGAGGAPEKYRDDQTESEQGCIPCDGGPVAALIVHGMNDTSEVPFAGGDFARKCWAETNACTQDDLVDSKAPCKTYKGCSAGHDTMWCPVPDLGHELWLPSMQVAWDMFKALP